MRRINYYWQCKKKNWNRKIQQGFLKFELNVRASVYCFIIQILLDNKILYSVKRKLHLVFTLVKYFEERLALKRGFWKFDCAYVRVCVCRYACMCVSMWLCGEYSALYVSETNKKRNTKLYAQFELNICVKFQYFFQKSKNRKYKLHKQLFIRCSKCTSILLQKNWWK